MEQIGKLPVRPPFLLLQIGCICSGLHYIATLTKALQLDFELEIEKDCGYPIQDPRLATDGIFLVDAVFMPI